MPMEAVREKGNGRENENAGSRLDRTKGIPCADETIHGQESPRDSCSRYEYVDDETVRKQKKKEKNEKKMKEE